MGQQKKHSTGKDRVKAHRQLKNQNANKTAYCDICKSYIQCNIANDEKEALRIHTINSRTYQQLLKQEYPYWNPPEDEDGDLMVVEPEMELLPCNNHVEIGNVVDISIVNAEFELNVLSDANILVDVCEVDVVAMSNEAQLHDSMLVCRDVIPSIRQYLLVNTYLSYGKKSIFDVMDSPIFVIQKRLRVGFNNMKRGISPYEFSKVKNREVDWISAWEITRDYIDSNESIRFGDRRIKTTSNVVKRETGKSARIPKRMGTLMSAFCNDLDKYCSVDVWTGRFFDPYLDEEKKAKMRKDGVKWTQLKGCFVPIQCALAQMLLRLNVEDFDHFVGPLFRDVTNQSGEVLNVRSYDSFNSSKYAIEMQKLINALCIDDACIPLLLSVAVWVDKAPLNSSMTRKATPVMLFLMND